MHSEKRETIKTDTSGTGQETLPRHPQRTPAATRRLPRYVAALKAVTKCSLTASEKAVLRSMLEWWNPHTGLLWPSVATLAGSTGYSQRGVQKIIRRLELLGVVLLTKRSAGGRLSARRGVTNMYEMHLERLSSAADASDVAAGVNPERRSALKPRANPEPRSEQPRTAMRINPERRSDEPSIGNLPEEPTSTAAASRPPSPRAANTQPTQAPQVLSSAGWMDARRRTTTMQPPETAPTPTPPAATPSLARTSADAIRTPLPPASPSLHAPAATPGTGLRDALSACGVKGHMLESLSRSPTLTASAVTHEFDTIKADPNTRNAAAVLVARLAKPAGLMRQEPARPLEPGLMAVVAKLEQMRRNRAS